MEPTHFIVSKVTHCLCLLCPRIPNHYIHRRRSIVNIQWFHLIYIRDLSPLLSNEFLCQLYTVEPLQWKWMQSDVCQSIHGVRVKLSGIILKGECAYQGV